MEKRDQRALWVWAAKRRAEGSPNLGVRGRYGPKDPGRRTYPHDVGDPGPQDPGVWV